MDWPVRLKKYGMEDEIAIHYRKVEKFNCLKHLKNQGNFSKWYSMDPEMRTGNYSY